MAHYDLKTSQLRDYVGVLKAGDTVSLTGTVYTARDAAHKKILAALENGEQVPFDIQDSVVYYAGPTPAKRDKSSAPAVRPLPAVWTRSLRRSSKRVRYA